MSIEIDWDALTSGPEGIELAEAIRSFIHDKFQQIPLPRFIRAVEVHSFDFGDVCPKIILKDLTDPLPHFYEDDEDDEDDDDDDDDEEEDSPVQSGNPKTSGASATDGPPPALPPPAQSVMDRRDVDKALSINPGVGLQLDLPKPPLARLQSNRSLADQIASPLLSRSGTPGIPGGTSNLSYFHLPLAGRMQSTVSQTPMSAVRGWQQQQALYQSQMSSPHTRSHQSPALGPTFESGLVSSSGAAFPPDPSTRPSTAHSQATSHHPAASQLAGLASPHAPPATNEADPNDMQIVLHISYDGNVRLSLTAEILLDFPMPSFVGIPFKLNITGLDFDGVALLAFRNVLKSRNAPEDGADRRAHFCFLSPEDAETLVGVESELDGERNGDAESKRSSGNAQTGSVDDVSGKLGGLLRGIRVESEIGKTKDGKQNLKNLGKVEKFILEQVRRIFEDEFVLPSFWTFLV